MKFVNVIKGLKHKCSTILIYENKTSYVIFTTASDSVTACMLKLILYYIIEENSQI